MKYRKEYLQNGGGFCPYCRSDEIEGDDMEFDRGCMEQRIRCHECSKRWWDHYSLEGIVEDENQNGS